MVLGRCYLLVKGWSCWLKVEREKVLGECFMGDPYFVRNIQLFSD